MIKLEDFYNLAERAVEGEVIVAGIVDYAQLWDVMKVVCMSGPYGKKLELPNILVREVPVVQDDRHEGPPVLREYKTLLESLKK